MKKQSINNSKRNQDTRIYLGKTISGEEIFIEQLPVTTVSKLVIGKLRHSCKRCVKNS